MFSGRRTRPAALSADDIMVRMVNCGTSIALLCFFCRKRSFGSFFFVEDLRKGGEGFPHNEVSDECEKA